MSAEAAVKLTLHDRITERIKRIEARFDRMVKRLNFDRVTKSAQRFGKSLSGIGERIERTGRRLGMLTGALGLGGGGLIAAVWGTTKGVADLGGELDGLARRAGVSAEALQELVYAGGTRGVTFDAMVDGLKELNLRADEFVATGKGTGAEAFTRLGYSASELREKLKDPAALFEEIVERLSKLDQSTQIRFTDELFGGSAGEQFQQMIGLTAKQLRELRNEARATGSVLGNDVVDMGREFLVNWNALTLRLDGFRKMLGAQLLPTINDAVLLATEWVDANRELIKGKIEEWAKRIAKVVKDLLDPTSELRVRIDEIIEGFQRWGERLAPIVNFLGGPMNTAIIALAAWVAGPLVAGLALASFAFMQLGVAIMTTPVGWILGGLLAIGAVAYVLYKKWDDFLAYWGGLWGRVEAAFEEGFFSGFVALWKEFNPLTHIIRGLDAVVEYFTGFSLIDAGARVVGSFMDGLKAKWAEVQAWAKDSIADLFGWLPKSIQSRLGIGVDIAPSVSSLPDKVARTAEMSLPSVSAVPSNPASDPRVAAVQALSQEPVNVSRGSTVDASTHIDSMTIQAPPGANAKEIAAEVKRALAERDAEKRADVHSALED